MTMTNPPDAPLVVAAFLARYFADQTAGTLRSREDYEVLFPGYAEVVAAEWERLQKGEDRDDEVEGERLAGYRIVKEIGRGGQGIVYLAEDERLARQVALKVLPGAFSATVARQRLLREAQAASRLDDPGICTVFDAGEEDGVAFIAMRYVDGPSMQERIDVEREQRDAGALQLADALRIKELLGTFEALLRSLHRAHEKGLVHRDIKPSNLMISLDHTPMILDFGLAAFDDHPDGSLTGEVALGTPAYMSPEQLTAREGRVDARSDVFSMAVTLYEAIALVHPFEAPTRERLYQHILQDEAPPLRKVIPSLSRDIDVVLQCALSKDRARRYASALAFAEDLRAVRLHEPIQARRVSGVERAARWAQRNPVVAALATVLTVATVVFTLLTVWKNAELTDALAQTNEARAGEQQSLNRERAQKERAQALYLVGLASAQLEEDPELSLLLAREARQRLDHHLTRSVLRAALGHWQPRPFVPGITAANWVRVSPDGARVAVDAGEEIAIIDARTHERVASISSAGCRYDDVFWSADARHLLVARQNRLMVLGSDENGSEKVRDEVIDVSLHDGATGTRIAELPGHRGKVTAVDFKGRWLATGDGGQDGSMVRAGTLRVWELATGAAHLELPGSGYGVAAVRFVSNERAKSYPDIDVLTRSGNYRRVQGRTGKVTDERQCAQSDGKRLPAVFLLKPGRVCVDRGDQLQIFAARTEADPEVVAVGNGRRQLLATGALLSRVDSKRLSVVDVDGDKVRTLPLPATDIVYLAAGREEIFRGSFFRNTTTTMWRDTVQAVFTDGSVRSWPHGTSDPRNVAPVGGGVVAAHMSKDGSIAATIGPDGRVRVFEVWGGSALPTWNGAELEPWEALHPDGRRVVTFRRDEAVLVDMESASVVWVAEPTGQSRFTHAAWSPDGTLCALGSDEGEIRIVRTEDGGAVLQQPETGRGARKVVFDPTGRYLGVVRSKAELWDVPTGKLVRSFDDVPMVSNMVFAAGGERVVLSHTTSSQLRSVPEGDLVVAGDDGPWRVGVPGAVSGPYVLMARWHESFRSRVAGPGENWLVDARDGSRVVLPGGKFGRGGLSPDGKLMVLAKPDGSLTVMDREQQKVLHSLRGHDALVNRVLFAKDGSIFVTGYASIGFVDSHDERRVCVWSRDGELLQQLEFASSGVAFLDLTDDGEWVIVKTNDGDLRRYPVQPMKLVEQMPLRDFSAEELARFEIR